MTETHTGVGTRDINLRLEPVLMASVKAQLWPARRDAELVLA